MISGGPQARTLVFPAFGSPGTGALATLRVAQAGGWTVVEAAGELDWAVIQGLRDLLRVAASPRVVVDLREVRYVDRRALAVLARTHRHNQRVGGAVRLVGPPGSARALLRLTHGLDLPPVFASLEDAVS